MNRSLISIFTLFVILSLYFLFTLVTDSPPGTSSSGFLKEQVKETATFKPVEEFYLQRTANASKASVDHYFSNLKNAKKTARTRSAPIGFSADWSVKGPNNFGGRVNTLVMPPNQEDTIYAGFAVGGVYRTYDGGENWTPIFNNLPSMAVGHLVLDPNDTQTLYLGTGDPNIWGYPFLGSGLYKSDDGGNSWTYLGLEDTRVISKVIPHPNDPNIIYVSTMGLPFIKDDKRGVYKTIDGGSSWEKVLEISDSTGVIDLMIHPEHPDTLFAAGWDRVRNSLYSRQDGRGAGVYRSVDGGANWEKLNGGLPQGRYSRVGLAMSAQNPDHVFAMYVGTNYQFYAMFKSEDAGANWSTLTFGSNNGLGAFALGGFGWYFGKMVVDPQDENHIFILGVDLWETTNSGVRWRNVSSPGANGVEPHVDHHALLVTPSGDWIDGTDGGIYRHSVANDWEDIEDLPVTQFYHTAYNPHKPDFYYGGAQDNGTLGGLGNQGTAWERLHGGDGFKPTFHPTDSNFYYIEMQYGAMRYTADNGGFFTTAMRGIDVMDQINWDMPYAMSHFDPAVLYAGTHRMYKVNDITQNQWQPISPTLTNPVEQIPVFHNIASISLSPLDSNLILAGTSEGNIWKTEDDGQNWIQIDSILPNNYVSALATSHLDANRIFVAFSAYKDPSPSNEPLLYRSNDRGISWEAINGDLPDLAINDVLLFPGQNDQAIFVATDGGVYGTLDGGITWNRIGGNMPYFPIYDLDFNLANNELIAATFSHSIQTFDLSEIGLNLNGSALNLSGTIATEEGQGIANVDVEIELGNVTTTMNTANDGVFSINNLQGGEQLRVSPFKNTKHRNGVSTFDIILTSKHITSQLPLNSPYKIIAADANNSGTVSTFDIITIRKMILFIDTAFTQNTSWRFVPERYIFSNPADPFASSFPEVLDESVNNQSNLNFVGIKIGDVNGSANTTMLAGVAQNRDHPKVIQLKQCIYGNEVRLYWPETETLTGFQMAIEVPEGIDLEEIRSDMLDGFSKANYHWDSNKRRLYLSWNGTRGQSVKEENALLNLFFDHQVSPLNIVEDDLFAEAYDDVLQPMGIQLSSSFSPSLEQTRVSFINPISEHTLQANIQFTKPENLEWILYNYEGRILLNGSLSLPAGTSTWREKLPSNITSGAYFIQLIGENWQQTEKLLIQK